jgi:type IV pilus assembly protein PilB
MEPLDSRFHNPAVSRIKVMAELDIAERRIPQDGRFKLRIDTRTIDFRVSILPSANGESVVIRILAKEEFTSSQKGLHLEALGFRPEDLQRFRRASLASYGMVLVTGPTGSGKTTTLYAAINEVNTQEDKIITIEDPVEYQLKGVVQIPVHEKKGLTFARGLRSILRHDPDKIMVGEIRDAETAQIAIQSALTGHLVFTTVHANNAFDVIGRFVNMGIEPYNFVSSLNCIMAQRLVRRICQHCKASVAVTEAHCRDLGFEFATFAGREIFEGSGCAECHGLGYRGRLAITEFLLLTDSIKELILDHRPISEIKRTAYADGMTSLREAGINRILGGDTTMREVNRMTFTG